MNQFYEYYFNEYDFINKETAVCCPFPHHTPNGTSYFESNPSAHINISKGVFHCKVCEKGLSENGFISEILGCTYESASKISKLFQGKEDKLTWNSYKLPEDIISIGNSLGISTPILEELDVKSIVGDELAFPVFMYGKLLDVRSYRPQDRANKIKSKQGAISGLVIPFDIWCNSDKNKWTVICAGEKDMAVARSNGFNAITLTGGEKASPRYINPFKDRKIAICFDNDDAGIAGARSLASHLQPYASEVRVVTGFHEVCKEHGEDITDFFTKYNKTKADLIKYIREAPVFTAQEAKEEQRKRKPMVSLMDASQAKYVGRILQTNIQVVSSNDKEFEIPTTIQGRKVNNSSGNPAQNLLNVGEERSWELTENNCQDILKLMDNNFNESQIADNIRGLLGVTKMERDFKTTETTKETVYSCTITDLFEVTTKDVVLTEKQAYSIKKRLESGKKYLITYKLVPHPYKGRNLLAIILDAEDASDSISNFVVNDEVKQQLNNFKDLPGSVPERIDKLTEMNKSFIGYDGYNKLIQAIDLCFHTVLEFNFGRFENIRGYLDTLIIAESRVGKSSTAEALQKLYGLGAFASLAGNSATIPGIVGGSNKVNGNYQTRAGLIPMNHRGMIIFEELAKCNTDLIKELTDIRSSNQVRISRVSSHLSLPALVRMLTLTNVKSKGMSQPINSYPNGIEIVSELVGTPEDIARYDVILVMGETGNEMIDPFWEPMQPFEPEAYRTRVRWVWSRTPDQVHIDRDLSKYIMEQCNELNKTYDCHIKIFGTEAWKKVTRLAIAVAGYLVSTDETYENIIVKTEHVDWAINYYKMIYDNPTFKLKEYVEREQRYNTIDEDGVVLLQDIYNKFSAALLQLEALSKTNKQNLMAATGLDADTYNKMLMKMTQGLFIRFDGYDIIPTQRFRLGMSKIDRQGVIHRVGELDA